jgi:hypothetical protein
MMSQPSSETHPSSGTTSSESNGEDVMDEGTAGSDNVGGQKGTAQNLKTGRVAITTFPPTQTSGAMLTKAEEINLVLLQPEVDLWRLRELALSEGGLVNGKLGTKTRGSLVLSFASSLKSYDLLVDTLRKRAWPRLVGLDLNLEPVVPLKDHDSALLDHTPDPAEPAATPSTAPRFEIDTTEMNNSENMYVF